MLSGILRSWNRILDSFLQAGIHHSDNKTTINVSCSAVKIIVHNAAENKNLVNGIPSQKVSEACTNLEGNLVRFLHFFIYCFIFIQFLVHDVTE